MTTLAIFIHICWEENQENGNICAALLMELIFVGTRKTKRGRDVKVE